MKIEVIRKCKAILGKGFIRKVYNSLSFLPDETFVRLVYRMRMGKSLNLRNPQTFTEKLQYLKLHDHNPLYTAMADKIAMRDYVRERIGDGHTVSIEGVWNCFDEIDFSRLSQSFVLKTNHDSGSYFICKDKDQADLAEAKRILSRSLKSNYYKTTREWQYRDIDPKIFAEKMLDDGSKCLTDYKFFCFNGEPRFYYVEEESSDDHLQCILDMDGNRVPFTMEDLKSDVVPPVPKAFDEMVSYAKALSQNVPFLRVDMYYVNKIVYIGELTFYHFGGFIPFDPPEWDAKIGTWLNLKNSKD